MIGLFPLLALERGLTVSQVMTYAAAQGLAVLLLELPTSGFSDAFGRRPVLLAAAALNVAVGLVYLAAQSVWAFAMAATLMGVYRALDSGPLEAWYVDRVHAREPGADVAVDLSRQSTITGLSLASGALAAGVVIAWHPFTVYSALVGPLLCFLALTIVHLVATAALLSEAAASGRPWPRAMASVPAALADANQLEMAILNLAVNGRDAMPEGGTLRISATSEVAGLEQTAVAATPGRYVCLSVADTGVGMDEATLARAVEPFFSTKGIGRGTGLGLSMVHGLAAQLGGALTIQSTPGLGTNVKLWLPVVAAEHLAGPKTSLPVDEQTPTPAKGTVLLVDDEELVRATAADMLADLGYVVVEAGSAEEALRSMDAGLAPDLLVTDHLMPGLTGTELAHILRLRCPNLPVLIVSGYADVEGVAPDLPRLTKPFRRADLAASLTGLVGST